MTPEDIKNAVRESGFVDQQFIDGVVVGDYCVTHSVYSASKCIVVDNVLCAKAGCTDEMNEKGSVNQFINIVKLPANSTFVIDNMFSYRSDDFGRVSSALLVTEDNLIERTESGNENKLRAKKKNGGKEDEGGHIIARCLGGPNEAINIVPMNKMVNKELSEFEIGIKRLCNSSFSLIYEVKLLYSDSSTFRPSALKYWAFVENDNNNALTVSLTLENSDKSIS